MLDRLDSIAPLRAFLQAALDRIRSPSTVRVPSGAIAMSMAPGPRHETPEDAAAICVAPWGLLAVVADGIGGHPMGRESARRAVASICFEICAGQHEAPANGRAALRKAFAAANEDVFRMLPGPHGACAVAALIIPDRPVAIAWAGDCRAYDLEPRRGEDERPFAVTHDHTPRGQLERWRGRPCPDASESLLQAVGTAPRLEAAMKEGLWNRLLLASDGFYRIAPFSMLNRQPSASRWLIEAMKIPVHDDATAIVIHARIALSMPRPANEIAVHCVGDQKRFRI